MSALLGLAARVEALSAPDREIDAEIGIAIFDGGAAHLDDPRDVTRARKVLISHGAGPGNFEVVGFSGVSLHDAPRYTASLDAAMTLVPERWSYAVNVDENRNNSIASLGRSYPTNANAHGDSATPALALCAAALRAKAGQP